MPAANLWPEDPLGRAGTLRRERRAGAAMVREDGSLLALEGRAGTGNNSGFESDLDPGTGGLNGTDAGTGALNGTDGEPVSHVFEAPTQCMMDLVGGSGKLAAISDRDISASSYLHEDPTFGNGEMWRSRIDNVGAEAGPSWVPKPPTEDGKPWIQWDFKSPKRFTMVQLGGRWDRLGMGEFVEQFRLRAFDPKGRGWYWVGGDEGTVFNGVSEPRQNAVHKIEPPVQGTRLRLYPLKCKRACAVRATILGCGEEEYLFKGCYNPTSHFHKVVLDATFSKILELELAPAPLAGSLLEQRASAYLAPRASMEGASVLPDKIEWCAALCRGAEKKAPPDEGKFTHLALRCDSEAAAGTHKAHCWCIATFDPGPARLVDAHACQENLRLFGGSGLLEGGAQEACFVSGAAVFEMPPPGHFA